MYTFDKTRLDFSSDCEFVLAETYPPAVLVDAQFEISVINEIVYGNADSVTRAKCVRIIFKGHTAKLCNDLTATVCTTTPSFSVVILLTCSINNMQLKYDRKYDHGKC